MAVAKFFENQTEITVSQGVTTAAYLNDSGVGGFPMSLPNQPTTALIDRYMKWPNFKEIISHWLGNKAAIEFMGITYDGDDPDLLKATMIGTAVSMGKPLGELYYLDSLKTPVAFDKDAPSTFFPGKCLDNIAIYEDLAVANWPDLVAHLRAKALTYNEGITGSKRSFDVTDWAIATNVATLTFADTPAENAILTALAEDNLVHGSFANWRSITLDTAIGTITAGEYAITAIDPLTRTISFAFTAANGSASGTFTANFYTNRVSGSSTTARVYEATGRTLVSANDGENISGLRRRDRFQGFAVKIVNANVDGGSSGITGVDYGEIISSRASGTTDQNYTVVQIEDGNPTNNLYSRSLATDGTNGTPRTGLTTHGPESVGHLYLWGQAYTA